MKEVKKQMFKLTQETGIIKNRYLKHDFINRKKNIEVLEKEKNELAVWSLGHFEKNADEIGSRE